MGAQVCACIGVVLLLRHTKVPDEKFRWKETPDLWWCRCPRDTAALLLCQKVSTDGPILLAPLTHDTNAVCEKVSQAWTTHFLHLQWMPLSSAAMQPLSWWTLRAHVLQQAAVIPAAQ